MNLESFSDEHIVCQRKAENLETFLIFQISAAYIVYLPWHIYVPLNAPFSII